MGTLEVSFHDFSQLGKFGTDHNAIKRFESYKKYTGSKNFICGPKFRLIASQFANNS